MNTCCAKCKIPDIGGVDVVNYRCSDPQCACHQNCNHHIVWYQIGGEPTGYKCDKCDFRPIINLSIPTPSPEAWEKEFDERFINLGTLVVNVGGDREEVDATEDVKSFINSLLDSIEAMVKEIEWHHKTDSDSEINTIFKKVFEGIKELRKHE